MLTLWGWVERLVEKASGAARRPGRARSAPDTVRDSVVRDSAFGLFDQTAPVVQPRAGDKRARRGPEAPSRRDKAVASTPDRRAGAAVRRAPTMQERYDEMTRAMLAKYGLRVRKWRSSMSGVAWTVSYRDGTVVRLIESPRPRGPMSAAVFLHEVGHHAIGLGAYTPRCLEEYHAWRFALEHMEALGLSVTEPVKRRMHRSLKYAVDKALRRGLRQIPAELAPFAKGNAADER